jgi:hypothetical protein
MSLRSQLIPKNMPFWLLQQKVDIEEKQVSLAATIEYDNKGKCTELERFEREKAVEILDITTKNLLVECLCNWMPPWQSNLAIS